MKNWKSIIGSLILLVLGIFIFYLIGSGFYSHLLHPKFIWLTGSCGVILVIMAIVGLINGLHLKLSTVLILLLFVVLCIMTPFAKVHSAVSKPVRVIQDGQEYIPINIIELYMVLNNNPPKKVDQIIDHNRYVLRGFIYRNSKLDHVANFAVLRGVISCCIADACAFGFRIKSDVFKQYVNGEWVKVYGKLARFKPDQLENAVEIESSANSEVKEDFMLVPDKIEVDREPKSPFVLDWKDKEPFSY
jgi:hypothetical protein